MKRHESNTSSRLPPETSSFLRLHGWLLFGMTAVLVARPLFPSESAAVHGDGMAMVMLWLSLSLVWLAGAIGSRSFSIRVGWIDAAVLLLVGWISFAAIWATGHGSPRPAINMLWEWIGMGLCFFLARQLIGFARSKLGPAVAPREIETGATIRSVG